MIMPGNRMADPVIALPADIDSIPDVPAVFLLWPKSFSDKAGQPYLVRTGKLRRRLKRLLSSKEGMSRMLNLSGVIERIEYWQVGSQLSSTLTYLQLAQQHFPDDWQRMTRLRHPAFLRLTLDNPFPRTMISTRPGRGLTFGPFLTRTAAEIFEAGLLDLFQIRRCEENLEPTPEHPGCMYGEMNRCMRPCQQAVSRDEYRNEVARVEQFLLTRGTSLKEPAEVGRDNASQEMRFEEAAHLQQRVERIIETQNNGGPLARATEHLAGVAVVPGINADCVELWLLINSHWQPRIVISVEESAGVGRSLDHRLREKITALEPSGAPNLDHVAVLTKWYGSSWRDGEWMELPVGEKPWASRIPYRKLVNAIARIASGQHKLN